MRYYVYILQTATDDSYYIGYTHDLRRRLAEHNSGQSRYTSNKQGWRLVYYEDFDDKTDALKRELFLKRMKSRALIQRLILTLMT